MFLNRRQSNRYNINKINIINNNYKLRLYKNEKDEIKNELLYNCVNRGVYINKYKPTKKKEII